MRAAVESMAYQVADIVEALRASGSVVSEMKVDGGGASSDLLCQFIADMCDVSVLRPNELERTALGAAYIAAIGLGLMSGPEEVAAAWSVARRFDPQLPTDRRSALLQGWQQALARTLTT